MRVKQTIKQLISWLLIIVLIIPNIAFAEGEEIIVQETALTETELFSVQVFDPTGVIQIQDFSVQYSYRTPEADLTGTFDDYLHTFRVLSAANGDYALYFSSVQTDAYAFNEPFVFYVQGGKAYYDEAYTNLITGTINVNLREGLSVGNVFDSSGVITHAGSVSVDRLLPEDYREWCGGFDIKGDGSVYVPKEDGTFEVGVYPYDRFAQDMAVATVNVVGDVITGNQDMHFPVVQLYGQVFEKTGTPITNYQYSVEIVDDNGNHVKQANGFDNNGLAFYYRLSQLPEGNYGLILHPGEHYRSLGYIASSPVPFTVNSDGVATAETKDLMFREASAQPAELRYNHVETVPSNWGTLDVNFELMYAGATQFSDISCELIRMGPGTEGSPDVIIDQIPLDTIWNNEHGFE